MGADLKWDSMALCPSFFATSFDSLVWSVVEKRQSILTTSRDPVPDTVAPLSSGRRLLCDPFASLSDGAACVQSAGFFDNHNVPPWDTWVCVAGVSCLLSWVPPPYVELVNAGVEVNPEECIVWADRCDWPFAEILRRHGLL